MHHPIFSKFRFEPYEGLDGFRVNGLGVRERVPYYESGSIALWKSRRNRIPAFDEEYFEWIDILEAVDEAEAQFVLIEEELRAAFHSHGRTCVNDYSGGTEQDTPFGVVAFSDGVQTWLNPALDRARRSGPAAASP